MAKIDRFEMERYQSLHWHEVEHDLSESGVSPLTVRELLGPYADAEIFMQTALGYPLSEGSPEARHHIARAHSAAHLQRPLAVDPDFAGFDQSCGKRPRLYQSCTPEPFVEPLP